MTRVDIRWKCLHQFIKYSQYIFTIISVEKKKIHLDELDKWDKMGKSRWNGLNEKTIEDDKV